MAEYQFQFNYLEGTGGNNQLYYDFQLWYSIRPNYWGCTKCLTYISTDGDKLKYPDKALPIHTHEGKFGNNSSLILIFLLNSFTIKLHHRMNLR